MRECNYLFFPHYAHMNILKWASMLVLLWIVTACGQFPPKPQAPKQFKPPVLVNRMYENWGKIRQLPQRKDYMQATCPDFLGKHAFCDTLDIGQYNTENPPSDSSKYYGTAGYGEIHFFDSLDVNGLELVVDYENEVFYNPFLEEDSFYLVYYPVFFVNTTSTPKLFFGKDFHVFGIQEAVDSSEMDVYMPEYDLLWHPIEKRCFDFCALGGWAMVINPGEFALVLMEKYKGDYPTAMRVRFQLGANIVVSKPFHGWLNPQQFFPENRIASDISKKSIDTKIYYDATYYGATPKVVPQTP